MLNKFNKIEINLKQKKELRRLFFIQDKMPKIVKRTNLTERVIRRFVKENNWIKKRLRWWQSLVNYNYRHGTNNLTEISKRSGVRGTTLWRIKREMGVATKRNVINKRMTKDIEDRILAGYAGGLSSIKISKETGFKTHKTILDVLVKASVRRRSTAKPTDYQVDYFKYIDSHDKAYILGLLLTDGYVIKRYSGFAIQLTEADGYLLDRIASRMGESAHTVKIKCDAKRKKMPNAKDMVRLSCFSSQMAKDLMKFNMVTRKSLVLECPIINKKYLSSFCRGLWDGDGSIGIGKRGYSWCKLSTASGIFSSQFVKLVTNFKFSVLKDRIWNISVLGGESERSRFFNWIYKNKSDLFLQRKYDKIKSYIK